MAFSIIGKNLAVGDIVPHRFIADSTYRVSGTSYHLELQIIKNKSGDKTDPNNYETLWEGGITEGDAPPYTVSGGERFVLNNRNMVYTPPVQFFGAWRVLEASADTELMVSQHA